MKKALAIALLLVVIIGIVSVIRARGALERGEAVARALFVPVIVTPSIQLGHDQVLLYKATNVSERPGNLRLSIFNDREGVPGIYKDFMNIPPGHSVSFVHEPPVRPLTLGATTIDAPEAVRAMFAPVPGDDPGAVRRIVANAQILRIQRPANAAPTLDMPVVVPLSHCNFEPRNFVPYRGGQWFWNCAPQMYPIDEMWRAPGQSNAGPR